MKCSKIVLFFLLVIPSLAIAQLEKGDKLFEDFHYSKAVKYYKAEVGNRDERVAFEATMKLAECYIKMNNLQETIFWLQELERFDSSHPKVYFDLGTAYRKSGQYQLAAEQYAKFNTYRPTEASLAYESYCKNIELLEDNPDVEIRGLDAINTDKSEFCPIIWDKSLLFTTDRNSKVDGVYGWTNFGFCKVFAAKNANPFDVFSAPDRAMFYKSKQINQKLHSGPLAISGDQRSFFLTRTENVKKGKGGETIHLSLEYGSVVNGNFKVGKDFPFNNAYYNVGHATLSKDGKMVIFSSDAPNGEGEGDLYVSYARRGRWSEPASLGNVINGFGNEVFPFLANDTTLYFSSTTHFGYGGLDCFISYKQKDGQWTQPANLGAPINSSYDDFGFYLIENSMQGYVCSDREGGVGADDIYAFRMGSNKRPNRDARPLAMNRSTFQHTSLSSTKEVRKSTPLKGGNFVGKVLNEQTLDPISDAYIFVLHPTNHNVHVYKTGIDGTVTVDAQENELLVMHVLKNNCSESFYQFRVPQNNSDVSGTTKNFYINEGGLKTKLYSENVYFDLDHHNLNKEATKTLSGVVTYIKNIKGDYKIYLDSHADIRGGSQYNRDLSWQRAHQSMKYLVDHGIPSRLITIDWHGDTNPSIGSSSTYSMSETAHSRNRRTEIRIEHKSEERYSLSLDPSLYKEGDILPMEIFPMLFFNVSELDSQEE